MSWGHVQQFKWPGLGPAQMSRPLASTDSMVLTCQNALRNLKALLRILRVGGRGHTSSPEVENSHITWLGVRKCHLTSWTASKPHRNWAPESRAKTGAWYQDPEQTVQARTRTLSEAGPGQSQGGQKTSKA